MERKKLNAPMPQHDYHTALQGALNWLGDRYLLAEPAPRLQERTPYFAETPRWHPSVVAGALAKTQR